MSGVGGTIPVMGQAAVRVRLDVTDVQAGVLWRAAGARRFAYNWAVAKIKANADQWHAEATYDIAKPGRVRPMTYFDLAKLWTAAKPTAAPWSGEHSTWTFRYGIRAAAEAHQAFLIGRRRFPRFKSRRTDRARFTVADGLHLEAGRVRLAKYGWFRIAAPCAAQATLRRLLRRGHARLLNVTVARHSDRHWYATVCYDRPARTPAQTHHPPVGPVVGVDRGVRTSAVAASPERRVVAELAGLRSLRDARRKVAHLQRDFARTHRGSANRVKAGARLARTRCTPSPPGCRGRTRSWWSRTSPLRTCSRAATWPRRSRTRGGESWPVSSRTRCPVTAGSSSSRTAGSRHRKRARAAAG